MKESDLAARVGPHAQQPILACAQAQSGGALRGLDRGAGGGIGGMLAARGVANKARQRSGDQSNQFPADVVLALTTEELLVFSAKRDPGPALARYRRQAVDIRPAKLLLPVTITVPGGIVQFRAIRRLGGDSLLSQLVLAHQGS